MTARERTTVEEVNRKVDTLAIKVDAFIGEIQNYQKDFVQPLVKEKADRVIVEKQLKTWGKWASVALGLIVSLSILIRNVLGR